jgi:hypothetical protein
MILGRERIDASIDADVANKEFRALDKVRHLINVSPAETTCGSYHRRAPSLPSQRYLEFGSQIRKRPSLILAVAIGAWDTTTMSTQRSVNDCNDTLCVDAMGRAARSWHYRRYSTATDGAPHVATFSF